MPIFMIRRGKYKFVSSSHDGIMLFDLETDPNELTNLAQLPEHTEVLARLATERGAKWDETALTNDILLSQKRRLIVREAMGQGKKTRWNHGEAPTDRTLWYRGEQGYNEWAFDYI